MTATETPVRTPHVETWTQGGRAWGWQCLTCREETEPMFSSLVAAETDGSAHVCAPASAPTQSPAEELRAAAAAMTTEADGLATLDRNAYSGPWSIPDDDIGGEDDVPIRHAGGGAICASPDDGVRGGHAMQDAELIVHRRNTIGRDALTLRATARLLLDVAASIDTGEMVAGNPWAIARAFAFTGQEVPLG